MKIRKILDNAWFGILIILGIIFYVFMFSAIIGIFVKKGVNSATISGNSILMTIILLSFSYLIVVYIQRTKKDREILEIMEDLHERTDGYRGQVAFSEGMGPIGQLRTFLDHGGFFLFPFIQRRKNYRDIDVNKIPFKKKFPFILFFISFFSVPIFGLIAWAIN